MLYYSLIFLIVGLIAGALGIYGVAAVAYCCFEAGVADVGFRSDADAGDSSDASDAGDVRDGGGFRRARPIVLLLVRCPMACS